jgi:hypothetical protein
MFSDLPLPGTAWDAVGYRVTPRIYSCTRFVKAFHEFAGGTYDELEFSVFEPYMTPHFFQSCFLVQFLVLEELASFGEPSAFRELIEAGYDDSYAPDPG